MLKFNNKNLVFDSKTNTVKYIDLGTGKIAANMKLGVSSDRKTLTLNHGRTMPQFRRRGIGTYLRAQIIKAAKNAGFNTVNQVSNSNNSKRIMKRLGGNQQENKYFVFNLTKNLPKGVVSAASKKPLPKLNKNALVHIGSMLNNNNNVKKFSKAVGVNLINIYLQKQNRNLMNDIKKHRKLRPFVPKVNYPPAIQTYLAQYFGTKALYPNRVKNLSDEQLLKIMKEFISRLNNKSHNFVKRSLFI